MPTPLLLTCLLLIVATDEPQAAGTRVAVLELKAQGGISPDRVALVGELLQKRLREAGLDVIGMADIQTMLDVEATKQLAGCEGESSCLAEIGNALGVDELVHGAVGTLGSILVITLKRTQHKRLKTLQSTREVAGGEDELLVRELPSMVAELYPELHSTRPAAGVATSTAIEPGPWPWVMVGVGAGLVAFGGVATAVALNAADEFNAGERDAERRNRLWWSTAVASFGVGAAAVAGGLLWRWMASTPPPVSAGIGVTSTGAVLSISGAF